LHDGGHYEGTESLIETYHHKILETLGQQFKYTAARLDPGEEPDDAQIDEVSSKKKFLLNRIYEFGDARIASDRVQLGL
jgi:hypothetical protein